MINSSRSTIVVVIAAILIACGRTGGTSGSDTRERGAGDAYLTADQTYGVQGGADDGPAGGTSTPADGPQLQP